MTDYEILYLRHFNEQKAEREFPDGFAETLFRNADNYYYDNLTDRFVAVKRARFKGRERDIALAYEIASGDVIVFVTITLLKERQQQNRVSAGRWERHEPESNL